MAANHSNGRYLQDAFNVPLVIMLTDDEKFLHSPKLSLKDCRKFALENALDIIAIGFDPAKTFIFADTDFIYGGHGAAFGFNILEIGKKTTNNQIKGTFGFTDTYVVLMTCHPSQGQWIDYLQLQQQQHTRIRLPGNSISHLVRHIIPLHLRLEPQNSL